MTAWRHRFRAARRSNREAPEWRLGAVPLVFEDVARVIDDDIEDDVEAARMRFIHELAQVSCGAKARIDLQQILEAVAVIRALQRHRVLEHRGNPQRSRAEGFDVSETVADAPQGSPLKAAEFRVERQVGGWASRIVEAVNHQEVDRAISPFGRRGIWLDDRYGAAVDRNGNRCRLGGCGNGSKNARIANRRRHSEPPADENWRIFQGVPACRQKTRGKPPLPPIPGAAFGDAVRGCAFDP